MAVSNVELRVDARNAVQALKKTNDASKKLNDTLRTTERRAATATGNIQRMGVSFRTTVASVVALTGAATFLSRSLGVLGQRQADAAALANGLEKLGKGEVELQKLQKAADELGKATLFDQEDFDRGFALLTSFTSIGVDSFERVASAAADVAQITKQDVNSSLLQLAKALQDPVRGLTALSRSGTTFTEQQKEQIKALVESGQQLKAQDLILREIEKQYGNAAKAAGDAGYAGAVDSLGESFRDFQERLAKGVEPAVTTALKSLTSVFDVISKIPEPVGKAALGIGALTVAVYGLNAAILANPYLAAAAGLAAIAAAAVVGTQKVQRFAKVVKITGNTVEELDKETQEVQGELKRFRDQLDAGGRRALIAKEKVKQLEEALEAIEGRRKIIFDLKVDVPFPNFDKMGPGFQEELDRLLGNTKDKPTGRDPADILADQIKAGDEIREQQDRKLELAEQETKFQQQLLQIEYKRRDEAKRILQTTAGFQQEQLLLRNDAIASDEMHAAIISKVFDDTAKAVSEQKRLLDIRQQAQDKFKAFFKDVLQKEAAKMNQIYASIGKSIQTGIVDSLTAAVDGTKKLADVAADTLRNVANILLQFGVNTALGGLSTVGGTGSIFDKLFGGFRASGGSVKAGTSYMVGERGPELFTPGRSGSIAPSGSFGGANVVVNVDASGTQAQGNQPNAKLLGQAIGAAVQAELIKQKRPGGLLAV